MRPLREPLTEVTGVGTYAYYDTGRVAATAIEPFENEITTEPQVNEHIELPYPPDPLTAGQ